LLGWRTQPKLETMPSYRIVSLALAGAAAIGCSAPVVDDVADASGSMTEGVVSVERMIAADGATQTNVSAKFMRLSSPVDPDQAARVVGTKLDRPGVGVCSQVAAVPPSPRVGAALGSIELIDVGDVTLHAGAAEMPLAVRAFPDVGDLVSGMFYTSRDATSDLPAGATYTLEGTGSLLVDRFAVDADAPPALDEVRVAGVPLLDGVTVEQGSPVTVQWRAGSVDDARSGDLVLVDVSTESGASVRCTFRDEGRGTLPAWVMRPSVLGGLPATAALSVHRVRARSFAASGIDIGEVRFDLSVMGRVVVTPLASASRAVP
jgi:hypothetical protein